MLHLKLESKWNMFYRLVRNPNPAGIMLAPRGVAENLKQWNCAAGGTRAEAVAENAV